MSNTTILLADDEDTLRENLTMVLREEGFDVIACPDGSVALDALRTTTIDAIITDLRMPGVSGIDLLGHAAKLAPDAGIIVITAFGHVDTAAEAMKLGAKDYLCKPLILDELVFKVKRLIAHGGLCRENKLLREQIRRTQNVPDMIGNSASVQEIRKTLDPVSQTMSSVLISGESGTGKEVLARTLHFSGITRDRPFVPVNCGGIVETLVESEFFGYCRGAFTGADSDHIGFFEAANEGTLFLDEIANLPMIGQAILLRAIEEKAITRVGEVRSRPVHIRIIAATNRNIEEAVKSGDFRDDLYYRLNVVQLTLPPLRDRPEDIPSLVTHFIEKYNAELKCHCPGLEDGALDAMCAHKWPGNVRELENVIERALIFAGDEPIRRHDLSIASAKHASPAFQTLGLRAAAREFERKHIMRALLQCGNNRAATAQRLRIGLSSLYRKMEELDISKSSARSVRM